MEWIQTLLISGLCIPSFCADYRQHCLIETPKSWSDAQSYCRERGYDLATIDDMGAIEPLLALNADRAHDELWIGLHYGGPERWQWSLADKDFYQEGERDYRNFKGELPGFRFTLQYNSKWYNHGNPEKHVFVCYDGNRQGGGRYVLVREGKTWIDAQVYCRRRHTDLVSIRNSTENQAVAEASGGDYVWTGLFKEAWYWSDGRYSSLRLWDHHAVVGNFPQSCAVMTSHISGRWSQRSCHELHPFLCTCTRKWVLKVKVHSEDGQELNDPAMKTAILKQTQQLLNVASLSNHHKIAWKTNSDGQVFTKEQCQEEDGDI
ncbi:unnamed protein product [Arctogadus glacialis]